MAEIPFFKENIFIKGPSFHVDLAALDARHPVHYSRRLLIFRCDSTEQRNTQLAAFKVGLQALVSRCPILGGTIVPLPPNEAKDGKEDWCTIVPGEGIELVVRDLSSALPSLEELEAAGFPSQDLPYALLVPVPQDIGNDRSFAACKMQLSAIAGGTILTWAMSHSVGDGSANNELMRILSEETRLAQGSRGDEARPTTTTETIGLDRSVLRNMTSSIPFNISDHPAYIAPIPPDEPPHPFSAPSPELPVLLRLSPTNLAQLKSDATPSSGPPISTHDALSALIWRSVLLIRTRRSARTLPNSTKTSIFMPSDVRRHLAIPQPYIGNAAYQLTASLELGPLLSPAGLREAAAATRRAILAVKPEGVKSYMVQLKERWVDWGFLVGTSTVGVAMGTDWTSGGLYGDDWGEGFGPLLRYRYAGENGAGNCVFPKLADGSAEVCVGVTAQEEDVLTGDECFGKYLLGRRGGGLRRDSAGGERGLWMK